MPSPIHRSPLVTARINPAAGSATAPAAPPAEPDATPAARAEVWLSHGCDDPDIVIVWHERTQHDQDRGVTTADVVARYPAAEFVIADLTWFHAESEPYRFYVTGHGAPEPIAFPEDTIAIGRWAHGFLTAANALGGWGAFAWEVECRQDHEAADWADEATRNPYL